MTNNYSYLNILKFTTERPENFSKTKLKEIKIKEVNKPQDVIDKVKSVFVTYLFIYNFEGK